MFIVYMSFYEIIPLAGRPDPPIISRTSTKVTAVSLNLVWTSGFNGGFTQTFTVIYQKLGSQPSVSLPVPDPGYQRDVNLFVGNLNESTTYEFIVRAQNSYNGSSAAYSTPEQFTTNGRRSVFKFSM